MGGNGSKGKALQSGYPKQDGWEAADPNGPEVCHNTFFLIC